MDAVKSVVKNLLRTVCVFTLEVFWLWTPVRWWVNRRSRLGILNFHSVSEHNPFVDRGLVLAPDEFRRCVRFCSRYGILPLREALDRTRDRAGLKFVMTFDEGYQDNYTTAWPILREFAAPFTVFVSTGPILNLPSGSGDCPALWINQLSYLVNQVGADVMNRRLSDLLDCPLGLHKPVFKTKGPQFTASVLQPLLHEYGLESDFGDLFANPKQVAEWGESEDATVGLHTENHVYLAAHPRHEQMAEIANNLATLGEWLGERPDMIAYPFGDLECANPDTFACLAEMNVRWGLFVGGGFENLSVIAPHKVHRIDVGSTYLGFLIGFTRLMLRKGGQR